MVNEGAPICINKEWIEREALEGGQLELLFRYQQRMNWKIRREDSVIERYPIGINKEWIESLYLNLSYCP